MSVLKVQPPIVHNPEPNWFFYTNRARAELDLDAASTHYTYMMLIEDGVTDYLHYGSYEHHWIYWQVHQENAWEADPKYCKQRGLAGR